MIDKNKKTANVTFHNVTLAHRTYIEMKKLSEEYGAISVMMKKNVNDLSPRMTRGTDIPIICNVENNFAIHCCYSAHYFFFDTAKIIHYD